MINYKAHLRRAVPILLSMCVLTHTRKLDSVSSRWLRCAQCAKVVHEKRRSVGQINLIIGWGSGGEGERTSMDLRSLLLAMCVFSVMRDRTAKRRRWSGVYMLCDLPAEWSLIEGGFSGGSQRRTRYTKLRALDLGNVSVMVRLKLIISDAHITAYTICIRDSRCRCVSSSLMCVCVCV